MLIAVVIGQPDLCFFRTRGSFYGSNLNKLGQACRPVPCHIVKQAIDAGGVNLEEISNVRIDFPSISVVRGHSKGNSIGMIHLTIKDERNRAEGENYQCVVDIRSNSWFTHVINLRAGVRHPHVYTLSLIHI